jgi:hypothetical protein
MHQLGRNHASDMMISAFKQEGETTGFLYPYRERDRRLIMFF